MVGVLPPAGRRLPLAPTNAIVHNPKDLAAENERRWEAAAAAAAAAESEAAAEGDFAMMTAAMDAMDAAASLDAAPAEPHPEPNPALRGRIISLGLLRAFLFLSHRSLESEF